VTLIIEIPGMKPVTIEIKTKMAMMHEINGWAEFIVEKALAGEPARITLEIKAGK
jgi:hypothetical protein